MNKILFLIFLVIPSLAQSEEPVSDGTPFPHTAMYGGMSSGGWPFVGDLSTNFASSTSTLNYQVINAYAKFPMIILPPTPLTDGRPDILAALRAANPQSKIWAYVLGHVTWCPYYPDVNYPSYPPNYYYRHYWEAVWSVGNTGTPTCTPQGIGFLWLQDGTWPGDVNLAYQDTPGHYAVAEALADVIYTDAYLSRAYDGIFFDIFCDYAPYNNVDYARAGYGTDNSSSTNRDNFNAGWKAGHTALANRLRSRITADGNTTFPISGNCGQGSPSIYPIFNGWMRENFPYQNGGTWYANMYWDRGGYLHEEHAFRWPQYNFIFTGGEPPTDPYSSFNCQKMRFGLATATLGNGYHAFEETSAGYGPRIWYFDWWYDEYGVDSTGRASGLQQNNGYLGQPLTDDYQMVWNNPSTDPISNPDFESNTSSWVFIAAPPAIASLTRVTDTAARGNASIKIQVDQRGTSNGSIYLSSQDTFPITINREYSMTFWAKAGERRKIEVGLGGTNNGSRTISLTPYWKQYQVVVKPTFSSGSNNRIVFTVGQSTGPVWLDDIHVQQGVTSVYRRDFQNGIILVNPTETALAVNLEKPYRKILGTVSPEINDGSTVTSVNLAATSIFTGIGDALFLLDPDAVDTTPPQQTQRIEN
ncbi:MAG: carbohydrate binding domain-containing protein [Elusimicrobia bacterium]|nr:carbohydrate binding domain-containing protein [Elusimicrobiota bacterium]